ncbi:hypothetical protein [Psychroflexus tropicus]|uniref:hypothetical protein n=1 Tax=Psychroflexus tropicus TaxID=197345 RepID=UPI00036AB89E|nr:hypothetical protein [Psychroflexus tropicus]
MTKFLKKLLLYGGLLFVLLNLLVLGSFWSLRQSEFYKPSFAVNQIKLDLDYVVLGSSTGLTTLNTKLIDSLTGWQGLNLSMDDTALPTHYLMLKHFLENGGQTQRCVLAITHWDVANASPSIGNNDHRFLPFIAEDYVEDHFTILEDEAWSPLTTSQWVPIYGLGYYNTELFYPSLISLAKPTYRNRYDDKGNYVYPKLGKPLKVKRPEVSDYQFNNLYLEKIQLLCQQNNIELILYQSPMLNQHQNTPDNFQFINHSGLLYQKTNLFYDEIHVNKKGRKKATEEFVKAITQ